MENSEMYTEIGYGDLLEEIASQESPIFNDSEDDLR